MPSGVLMSNDRTLFSLPEHTVKHDESILHKSKPRLKTAQRNQIEMKFRSLDDLVPHDHKVRDVWAFVEQLDLNKILRRIQSVENGVGRPATDPKILLGLWLYGVLDGFISSRTIATLCEEHIAYQWICGGVPINHHTLSDFATTNGYHFDEFLTQSIAMLTRHGFVNLQKEDVAQDGMRVRANAGGSSFRREKTLKEHMEEAKQYLAKLKQEHEQNPTASHSRKNAANLRAAKERAQKIGESIKELELLREERKKNSKRTRKKLTADDLKEMRSSTTDPEARIMKMACGGFRPGFNVQFATTTKNKIIVGVEVTNQGSDNDLMEAMVLQIKERCGCIPSNMLFDCGYVKYANIDSMAAKYPNCGLIMPVKTYQRSTRDPYSPSPKDSDAVAKWKTRMSTEDAKERYKQRSATAELSNAQARNRGFQQFLVRGTAKAKNMGCVYAVVHNMNRYNKLMKTGK
jgi:transposase